MWFFGANDTSYHWTLANSWGKNEENLNQVRHIMFVMALPLHLEFLLCIRYINHYWLHAAHIWESSHSFWWRSSSRSASNVTRLMLSKHATSMTNVAAGLFSRTFWVRNDFLRLLLVMYQIVMQLINLNSPLNVKVQVLDLRHPLQKNFRLLVNHSSLPSQ